MTTNNKENKSSKKYYWQHAMFIVLLVVICILLASLSLRYSVQYDWTSSQRNTLSEESQKVVEQMNQKLQFTIFASNKEEIRKPIQDLIERYKHYKPDIQYSFIDPDTQPALVRQSNVQINGEVIMHYDNKTEHLRRPTESAYSTAMQRIMRSHSRWLLFINGHGEREIKRQANFDVSQWVAQLSQRGIRAQSYQLINSGVIPDNTAALVIASPQVDYLPAEVDMIKHYLQQGGNLLWFIEPGSLHGLEPIAEYLHIDAKPGIIMDNTTKSFGIKDHRFLVIGQYPAHPVTKELALYTLFPEARAIDASPAPAWKAQALLNSSTQSWIATDNQSLSAPSDSSKIGSHSFGWALTRELKPASDSAQSTPANDQQANKQQRVIVIGDGDFLSNTYLGNVGNIEFGYNLANWLNQDDAFLPIPVNPSIDKTLSLDDSQLAALGIFFFFVLPLGFLIVAGSIWYKRRHA